MLYFIHNSTIWAYSLLFSSEWAATNDKASEGLMVQAEGPHQSHQAAL